MATAATSLKLQNVNGPLTGLKAREPLLVSNKRDGEKSTAKEAIRLILTDFFGNKTSGRTVDSGRP